MDPLTAAGAYAQIVGLMADFAASRGQRDTLEIKDFLEWLSHGHGQLKTMIESSHATSIGIKAALAEGSTKILERLDALEGLLAVASASQGPFRQVAMSLVPKRLLSTQQLAILAAFEEKRAGKALLLHLMGGSGLMFIDGEGNGGYGPDEPRFFETDLSGLVDLNLLSVSYNGKGEPVYHLTRPGHEIAKTAVASEADRSSPEQT